MPEQPNPETASPLRGKLKVYIGMSAGVGKSYRMLQDAHEMKRNGVHVLIGYIETHDRKETKALLSDLPVLPRREVFYKGKRLDELDVNSILVAKPEWVIVDELAHTNIPGSKNEKRYQDILEILSNGISVLTAVNIQHIESINEEVRKITGIEVKERVPDAFLQQANEVVNIDLTAGELIHRLREGKIYHPEKVEQALNNFFQPEKILQLRELALKEVATQVERKVEAEVEKPKQYRHEKILACISTNAPSAKRIIRKTARLANYYQSEWFVLFVQRKHETPNRIPLDVQRHLLQNFQLVAEMGGHLIQARKSGNLPTESLDASGIEILETEVDDIVKVISLVATQKEITTICIGRPKLRLLDFLFGKNLFEKLLHELEHTETDLIILS